MTPSAETTAAVMHAGAALPADNTTAAQTASIPVMIELRVETVADHPIFGNGTSGRKVQ